MSMPIMEKEAREASRCAKLRPHKRSPENAVKPFKLNAVYEKKNPAQELTGI
jgi:hypothetical protein